MVDADKVFPTQGSLGPLPVPSLEETCERYIDSLRPLLSDADLAHSEAVVADFCNGLGKRLQAGLEARAESERNWLEKWWEELAYLRSRTTMAVHINWFGVIPEWGVPMGNVQAAAAMLHGVLGVRAAIESGKYPLEKMRGQPLDMHQFTRVFGMTRVPKETCDALVQDAHSRHIIILRKGVLISLELYGANGTPLTLVQLQIALQAALRLADTAILEQHDSSNLSVLTSMDRDRWAAERLRLIEEPTNASSLRLVESAMFHLALDDAAPPTKEEAARLCLGGTGRNRWFDKSFTIVVFENGRGGLNAEHTPVDAMTVVAMFVVVLNHARQMIQKQPRDVLILPPLILPPPEASASAAAGAPRLLEWKVDPSLTSTLELASAGIAELCDDCDLVTLHFSHYGKGLIKRAKLHPDFVTQMAIQLAYYKLHERFVPTYETGHTRAFYRGRTDTVRTLSTASAAWVTAMCDPNLDATAKLAALRVACEAHGAQVQRVLGGQGIDRHLLGLYIMAQLEGERAAIFSDPAYKRSGGNGNYVLSTSNVGYTPLFGGFAPMTADGYGVCYALLEGRMNISITSWRSCAETDSTRMAQSLSGALVDLMRLFADTDATRPKARL